MIITRAPLRIPLGGGGTDLASYYTHYGGFVLSTGIDKYVYIQLNDLKVEDFIRVKYSQTEKVNTPDQIQHPLLREALIYAGIEGGIEISAMSDVPGRTGLGSSGAFTVALLAAVHAYKHEQLSPQELAEEAHYIEAVRAAQPAGKHDHYLGTFGGLTCLDIDTSGHVAVTPLAISAPTAEALATNMLVFFTGIRRESSDILTQQNQDTQQGDDRVLDSLHQTKRIGYQIKEALEREALDRFGELLHEHWLAKKQRTQQISNADIDHWYATGRAAGALGGKLLGAGGGGFLMFYCPAEHHAKLRSNMAQEGLREMRCQFATEGVEVLVHT
ncbi:MAG: galactokinase [Gemmatimonadetes bacterium]|nr:galactokinase [Gemmatimonadota bacterium]